MKRPYSIASSPTSIDFEFAIGMVGGAFTSKLDKLVVGDVIGIEGPFGHLQFKDEWRKACFIAGGTGVTPFVGILRYICDKKIPGEFFLFYSAKSHDLVLYRDEFDRIRRKCQACPQTKIRVVITLTRESASGYESGRFDDRMLKRYLGADYSSFEYWICGPKEMLASVRGIVESLGVDKKKIRLEGW